jgi:hypothetical protein
MVATFPEESRGTNSTLEFSADGRRSGYRRPIPGRGSSPAYSFSGRLEIFRCSVKKFTTTAERAYGHIDTMLIVSRPFRSINIRYDSAACMICQWRSFSTSYRRLAEKEPPPAPSPPPASPLEGAPRSYGKAVSDFTPKPLNRPLGLPGPPRSGENWGIDTRTWKQRRDDFVNYDKHLIRRKQL